MFLWVLWALTRPQNPQKHLYNLGGGQGKKMTFESHWIGNGKRDIQWLFIVYIYT